MSILSLAIPRGFFLAKFSVFSILETDLLNSPEEEIKQSHLGFRNFLRGLS